MILLVFLKKKKNPSESNCKNERDSTSWKTHLHFQHLCISSHLLYNHSQLQGNKTPTKTRKGLSKQKETILIGNKNLQSVPFIELVSLPMTNGHIRHKI
jgi:hypothetical protein